MEVLRSALVPWYPWIKALHVFAAMAWAWSTSVAWVFYLRPAFRKANANPGDPVARERRNQRMEAFDRGAIIEHVAFPVLVVTALLMIWVARPNLSSWNYLTAKLWLGILVFVPMEIVDVWLSHLGGNKRRIRLRGELGRYEQVMRWHWTFFRITEPIVVVFVPLIVFLAVAKPF